MFLSKVHGRIRLLTIITSALLVAAIATPALAAKSGSGGQQDKGTPAEGSDQSPTYALQGDAINNGTGHTEFNSTFASSSQSTWFFSNGGAQAGTTVVRSNCLTISDCTAIQGIALGSTGSTTVILGEVTDTSPGGFSAGVRGSNAGTGGNGIGVYGSQAGTGWGVYGTVSGGGLGVYGSAGASGTGVRGAAGTSGEGVYGSSASGNAVYGTTTGTTSTAGVYGTSGGSSSNGVRGVANTGASAYGVWGSSTSGYGVVGSGFSNGVYGTASDATSGNGVYGVAKVGVRGASTGTTINHVGVVGLGSGASGRGVVGNSVGGIALLGNATGTGSGFFGFSANGAGGIMQSGTNLGVRAMTGNSASYALVAGAVSGQFGHSYIDGNLTVTGACCASIETPEGNYHMYATQSTQNIFSDQGTAQLVGGKAIINIDPKFATAANVRVNYQVFLTPNSADTLGLAVVNKTATSFEVRELGKGRGNFAFDWRIDALRAGHEGERMAPASARPDGNIPDASVDGLITAPNTDVQDKAADAARNPVVDKPTPTQDGATNK
jgi:hypothetical protein